MSELSYEQMKDAAQGLKISIKGKKKEALMAEINQKMEALKKASATKLSESEELKGRAEKKVVKKVVSKKKTFKGFHPITGEPVE